MYQYQKEERKKNPRERANLFSLITFAYMGGLFRRALRKDLEEEDLYAVTRNCNSERCGNKLEHRWMREMKKMEMQEKPMSPRKMMWKRWGKRYILFGCVDLVFTSINSVIAPYALSNLVGYFTPGQTTISQTDAYYYAMLVASQNIIKLVFAHNYVFLGQTFGMEIKTAFSSLLYRKALRLSPTALSDISLGNIVNLITKDVQVFRLSIWMINDFCVAVIQVIVNCCMLYMKVGSICFVGLGMIFLIVPIQVFIGRQVTSLKLQTSHRTDERLEIMQEVLSTMKIIKMYTWEAFFQEKITYARRKEIIKMLLVVYCRTLISVIGSLFSRGGFYLFFLVCIWTGVSTDASVIFYSLSIFTDIKFYISTIIPSCIGTFGEFSSAYKRIITALEAEELVSDFQDDQPTEKPLVNLNHAGVQIKNKTVLNDISFDIKSGLTLITGPVGSGKSSVLKTILQDYPLTSGTLNTKGRIAYASQDPWLFPSSIKQNILFGEKYSEKKYQEVVKVCALLYDFNLFEKGDETIVTDRGLNLSKGQQARINLARAIYRDSEIYLLDDCLTALDSSVQDFIFKNCIQTYLKDKICILVSQTASQMWDADNVLIMQEGCIKYFGTPNHKVLDQFNNLGAEDHHGDKESVNTNDKNEKNESNETTCLIETEQTAGEKKLYHEVKKEGSVAFDVYKKYFSYGGGILAIMYILLSAGFCQFAYSYSDKLLTRWIDEEQISRMLEANITTNASLNVTSLSDARAAEMTTLKLYTILMPLAALFELVENFFMLNFSRKASLRVHQDVINKIMNGVMSFFDTHLIGNVLNRFSQDLFNIDENLSSVLIEIYTVSFTILGNLGILISVDPVYIIQIVIIFAILFYLRRLSMPAGRSLKRLEAAARSPMLGHLNATLEGLTTIRSCKIQDCLIEEYDRYQDVYTSANYLSVCSSRALGFCMDIICCSLIVVVIIRFVLFRTDSTAGDVGLALTTLSMFGRNLQWCLREWAELENIMTSVERFQEYSEIEMERKDGFAVENWPSTGSITYENVSLSYKHNNDYVLKQLNFEIKSKEKVGIVGRTGAGKSSIISTIFRLYEVEGTIFIDGVDIKTLPLDVIRKNIAIIPQDPILFSGSIRSNLDPLNIYEDQVLWDSLEKVGLKNSIISLHQVVSSSSLDFSSGQKQLICLARAILKKSKIVIMDEATANMDPETDKFLHNIIKTNFAESSVLTIAHRLDYILECDKVIVLDRGQLREFGHPSTLLSDTKGHFYSMVKQAGLLNYKYE